MRRALALMFVIGILPAGAAAQPHRAGKVAKLQTAGDNVVVDNRTLGTTTTIKESMPALGYRLTNTFTGFTGPTVTFNITGLPKADGTVAYIEIASTKVHGPIGSVVTAQINGATIGSVHSCICPAAQTITLSYIVVREKGAWRIVRKAKHVSG